MKRDYFHLDFVAGWKAESHEGLVFSPEGGHLRLPALAGRGRRSRLGGHPAVQCIKAMTADPCGDLYLLDAGKNLIRRRRHPSNEREVDGCPQRPLERIPAIGDGLGKGSSEPRRLRDPRGIAVGSQGLLYVADTGNNRVQVFESLNWALVAIWEGLSHPWGIVADAKNHRVFVASAGISIFDRSGMLIGRITDPLVAQARQLALSPTTGVLAVLSASGLVLIADGKAVLLNGEQPFTSMAFDRFGRLHAGTRGGVIHQYGPDDAGIYLPMGVSFSGVSGGIDAMIEWPPAGGPDDPVQLLLAMVREGDRRTTFWHVAVDGACGVHGLFVSKPLNSRIEQCPWHRLILRGRIPEGSSVGVYTQTAVAPSAQGGAPVFPAFGAQAQFLAVGPLEDVDVLVQSAPGQMLRFQLEFRSAGLQSPQLSAVDVEFPRDSYLKFLPAVYQDDGESRRFLDRFLSLFQTLVEEENQAIDNMPRLFDALTAPEQFLQWLAEWMAFPLDPAWDLAYQRKMLAGAFQYYQIRGTKAGIEQAVRDYARVGFAAVTEHFQLRRIPDICCGQSLEDGAPLWSPRIYSRWQLGAHSTVGEMRLLDEPEPAAEPFAYDAHRFSIFFPADAADPRTAASRVARVVAAEKPAHTEAILCAVYPRFRVGVQARVGVDSVVGAVDYMTLSGTGDSQARASRLGYDTILNPSRERDSLQRRGLDLPPAVGGTTRLS